VARLRRHNLRERFRSRPKLQRIGIYLFCSLSYPLFSALEVRRNLALLRRTRPEAGFPAALRMYGLAMRGNVPPFSYVFYDFEDSSLRALWPEYLYWPDREAVKMLNRLRGANPLDVQDKARFARICKENALPHAEVLAEFRPGQPATLDIAELEPGAELWVKPSDLQGGVGGECWRFAGDQFESTAGSHLEREAFLDHLRTQRCVAQRRLRNHPALDRITNGWLATLRLVLALRRDGTTVLLGNGLGLPCGSSITSASGMGCAVGWEDGVIFQTQDPLRPGTAASSDVCHPDTGMRLCGFRVPCWQESLDLVQRAHRLAFPKFATLGWDVAITPDGPVLLEANSGWDDHHLQAVFGPLGKTVLNEMIAEELPL
jgi:hypothetical protein